MNSPNYPPPPGGPQGPQGPYGPPQGQPQGQPYGGRPSQTPPGGQPYGGQPPQGQPFGAPPPQGQPYGGPPPQQAAGGIGGQAGQAGGPGGPAGPGGAPPAGYPTPPPPPPSAKPSNSGKIIKIIVGLVVVAGIATFAIINWGTSASSSEVGDCIKVIDAAKADVEKVECSDPAASYKVAFTSDDSAASCPGGANSAYLSYTETGKGDLLLCLTLNVKEGECISDDPKAPAKIACTDPSAAAQVTKVITGSTDDAGCPEGTTASLPYPDPKMLVCLGAPNGSQT